MGQIFETAFKANHTHTWWNNTSPLNNRIVKASGDCSLQNQAEHFYFYATFVYGRRWDVGNGNRFIADLQVGKNMDAHAKLIAKLQANTRVQMIWKQITARMF